MVVSYLANESPHHLISLYPSITADYAVVKPGLFNLTNTERLKFPKNGTIESYSGFLVNYDPSQPGKWKIAGNWLGFYWVVAVGDPVNGKYPWAVVSDALGAYVFVLARDVKAYYMMYTTKVAAVLQSQGFVKFWNKLFPTYQLGNCNYSW